jgi:hypothetical protein
MLLVPLFLALAAPAPAPETPPPAADDADAADADEDDDDDDDAEAASAAVPARTRLLVLDVGGDLPAAQRETLTSLVAARLSRFADLEVVSQSNVEQLLGLEAQKQLSGCGGDDGSGCLAELAGALDAKVIAVAQAGKLGGTTVFTLQLLDPQGATVGRGTAQVSGLDDLAGRVESVIDGVGREFTGDEPSDQAPPASTSSTSTTTSSSAEPALKTPLLIGGVTALGLGIVVAGVGVLPALSASSAEGELKTLRVQYVKAGCDDDLLQQAAQKQRDVDDARGQWNGAEIGRAHV